jgi:hypothetical protein
MKTRSMLGALAVSLLILGGCHLPPSGVEAPPPPPAAPLEDGVGSARPDLCVGARSLHVASPTRTYVWVPGHWTIPPQGYVWVPGHWRLKPMARCGSMDSGATIDGQRCTVHAGDVSPPPAAGPAAVRRVP